MTEHFEYQSEENDFDAADAAEEFVNSLALRCPKTDCFVLVCAIRDEPSSPDAQNGCPLRLDDDGLPLGGAY